MNQDRRKFNVRSSIQRPGRQDLQERVAPPLDSQFSWAPDEQGLAMNRGSRGYTSASYWLSVGGVLRSADQSRETCPGTCPAWPGNRKFQAPGWDLKNVP